MDLSIVKLLKIKNWIQFEKLKDDIVTAPKSQWNISREFDAQSQSFI